MAVPTTPQAGRNYRLYVSTTGVESAATIVNHGTAVTKRADTTTDTTQTFTDNPALTAASTGSETYSLAFVLAPGDPGQALIAAAAASGDVIWLHNYTDGNVGWKQQVTVGGGEFSASPGPFQTITYDAAAAGAKAVSKRDGYAGSDTGYII